MPEKTAALVVLSAASHCTDRTTVTRFVTVLNSATSQITEGTTMTSNQRSTSYGTGHFVTEVRRDFAPSISTPAASPTPASRYGNIQIPSNPGTPPLERKEAEGDKDLGIGAPTKQNDIRQTAD